MLPNEGLNVLVRIYPILLLLTNLKGFFIVFLKVLVARWV